MKNFDSFISWAKRRGFVFESQEMYSGLSGVWDFGYYGTLFKKNIKDFWWKKFVESRSDVVAVESSILTKEAVFKASGHLESFTDPMVECRKCQARFRADEDKFKGKCVNCGSDKLSEPKKFNLMFQTQLGEFLRPETAQGMFVNFKSILETTRKKIPFGIAQIGKSFRNELVSSGNFLFRLREFEIAEIEYFVHPEEDDYYFNQWQKDWENFLINIGLDEKNLKKFSHPKKDLAHYSKKTVDWQYKFPFGWRELSGLANRTDFDLKNHSQKSGKDLTIFDEKNNKKYFPYVIEPTIGIERLFFALLWEAFEISDGQNRLNRGEIILKINPKLSPIKVAIFPLVNKEGMDKTAQQIFEDLKEKISCEYDDKGSIGRRYRRQDEIGTLFCVTIDGETKKNKSVTIRHRDTGRQKRIKIKDLYNYLETNI